MSEYRQHPGPAPSGRPAQQRAPRGAAPDVRLSPAPFEVQGSVELRLLRGGEWEPLATAVSSATVTQDAAFSAMAAVTPKFTPAPAVPGTGAMVT